MKKKSSPPAKVARKVPPQSKAPRQSLRAAAESDIAADGLDTPAVRGLPFPVVGIGASAGGFEAISSVLKHLPPNTGMAFVVVLHLDPHHQSRLPELLVRSTSMPVREIRDGLPVEPNCVYVLPANLDVVLSQKKLRLLRRPEAERLHMAIDHFFISLAEEQGDRAIGVVLSGTGSDGTVGLAEIKAAEGITFAEAESSAKFFGMPRSAIDAGCVDTVLSTEAIAGELARVARHPLLRPPPRGKGSSPVLPEALDELGKVFFLLKQHCGVDFSLYKHTTLRRRITRRMVLQRIDQVQDYLTLLRGNPEEIEALFHDLLINVTGFFRDRAVYSALKKKVLPRLVGSKGEHGEVRVWVPGCATGEEVYSLAICLMEETGKAARSLKLQFFGTDLSEMAISKARLGIYPSTIAKDVSPERLRRFFVKTGSGYQISRVIRDMCTFARQNICEDPPFSRLDLISCRNVLIYLGPELQKKCLPVFHYALNAGGYLILGTSESLGAAGDLFAVEDKKCKVFSKRNVTTAGALGFTSRGVPPVWRELTKPEAPRVAARGPVDLQGQADRIILQTYAPGGVIIDAQLRVHEFRGRTGKYFEHAPGAATLNLLQMVRASLVVDLRTAIHRALKERRPVRKERVPLKFNGHAEEVNIDVVPFHLPPSDDLWLLVLFQELGPAAGEVPDAAAGREGGKTADRRRRDEAARLRSELDATKESLQSIIEEQEATNEELKSANEEIESANEELQSTNEELETAKEELQSTNEELTTLNEELSNRNLEMAQINNDLTNLFSSINLPIVMVDNDLAVRRVTPLGEKLFNLLPADLGRRLSDFKANVQIGNLDGLIHSVIDSLATHENKVQDTTGRWYSLRIRPYRTRDNKIDGAVITLVDIDEQQRSITQLEAAAQFDAAIFETIRGSLLVLDADLHVRKASRSFCEAFKLPLKKIEGVRLYEIGRREWSGAPLRELLEKILPSNQRFENFKLEQEFPRLGKRTLLLNARRLDGPGEPLILLAIEDVTEAPVFLQEKGTKARK